MELIQEQSSVVGRMFGHDQPQQSASPSSAGTMRPRVSFHEAVRMCWDKYTDCSGRARRSEYWWFFLFALMAVFVPLLPLGILYHASDVTTARGAEVLWILPSIMLLIALLVIVLFMLCPLYAATTRRLHDTGRSGKWIGWDILLTVVSSIVLSVAYGMIGYVNDAPEPGNFAMMKAVFHSSLPLLVVAGVFIVYLAHIAVSTSILVFTLLDSQRGENRYGRSPKYQP